MDHPFENPAVRYGIGFTSAAILAVIAFAFFDGTIRWLVLGMAVLEITVFPQFLKWAVAQNEA